MKSHNHPLIRLDLYFRRSALVALVDVDSFAVGFVILEVADIYVPVRLEPLPLSHHLVVVKVPLKVSIVALYSPFPVELALLKVSLVGKLSMEKHQFPIPFIQIIAKPPLI